MTRLDSPETTEFVNVYANGRRTQRVLAVASPLQATDVPPDLAAAGLALLGPVIGEVENGVRSRLQGRVGVGAQGWLRRRSADGGVAFAPWSGDAALEGSLAVFASAEDAPEAEMPGLIARWSRRVPFVLVTAGADGGDAYIEGREARIPAFPATEVDPTGAGDVFAAAFLARYAETSDPYESIEFAAAAAACSVEGVGTARVPDRAAIAARREVKDG
ncbi:MAG: ribokinase [Dehalococcoidia bacterium]|nr:ribokinase [Dehalococcoidia bacterium]